MPNGGDKNWVRLCAAIDGFRLRYGRWPELVRMYQQSLGNLRDRVLSAEAFRTVTEKVRLVADDASFVAEDSMGNVYDYGFEGFPDQRPSPQAAEWLGVEPNPDLGW